MDRPDERRLDIGERRFHTLTLNRPRLQVCADIVELGEEPGTHLPGGLAGKRDRRQVLHGRSLTHERNHAPNQRRRLSRPGRRANKKVGVRIKRRQVGRAIFCPRTDLLSNLVVVVA